MNIFSRPNYQSDATQFIDQLKARNPKIASGQAQGRALLWDKAVDRDAWRAYRAATVAQQPYVYQTSHDSLS